jgi:hypothetical protein
MSEVRKEEAKKTMMFAEDDQSVTIWLRKLRKQNEHTNEKP